MRERFVDAGGLRVRYLEEGDGAPTLLLHGASLGSSCDVWSEIVSRLAAHRLRVIAPDLPGFGGTDSPLDPSLGFRTRFVLQLMDVLGLADARVVGHSQSGRIALTLATKDPARVPRIVVVGTASLLPPLPGVEKEPGDGDEGSASEPTLDACRALLEGQLHDPSQATSDRVALRHRMSLGKNFEAFRARQEAKRAKEEKKETAPWQRVHEVTVPMRLIYGMQDRSAVARTAIAKESNPGLDLHLVDRCGHLVMWDAPEALTTLAATFLAK